MAKKKVTRKELLKSPDEFLTLSARAANFFNRYRRHMNYAGIAIGVIILAYLAVNAYMDRVDRKGQNAYNTASAVLTESLGPEIDAEKLKEAEKEFAGVVEDYGLSKAAQLALPQLGYVKFLEGRYDEAIAFYRQFMTEMSGNATFESLVRLALAACYEAKGDLKTAIETLSPVVSGGLNPFKAPAMISLSRLYRLDNQEGKAKEILNAFLKDYPDSSFAPMAREQL